MDMRIIYICGIADLMTTTSAVKLTCSQVAVFCASTEEIAIFILPAFVTEGDRECVMMEKMPLDTCASVEANTYMKR